MARRGAYVELAGVEDMRRAFARLELGVLRNVKAQIAESAAKIEAGAKARVRVDSGATRDAVRTITRDFGMQATIGSGDPNARTEEFGNVNKSAHPFLNPAFQAERGNYIKGVEAALNEAGREASTA